MTDGDEFNEPARGPGETNIEAVLRQVASDLSEAAAHLRQEVGRLWDVSPPEETPPVPAS